MKCLFRAGLLPLWRRLFADCGKGHKSYSKENEAKIGGRGAVLKVQELLIIASFSQGPLSYFTIIFYSFSLVNHWIKRL